MYRCKEHVHFLFLSSSNLRVRSSKSTSPPPPPLLDPGREVLGTGGRSSAGGGIPAPGTEGGRLGGWTPGWGPVGWRRRGGRETERKRDGVVHRQLYILYTTAMRLT